MEKTLIQREIRRNKYDKDNVRFRLKSFVEDFNAFVKENGRTPVDSKEGEHAIYLRWHKYTNSKELNKEEVEYLQKHLVKLDGISNTMKKFVKDYKEFIKINGRKPKVSSEDKDERNLQRKYQYYKNPKHFNSKEIEYLTNEGIISPVRDFLINFVAEFNTFVEKNGRGPRYKIRSERELYTRWRRVLNLDNWNDEEKEYLQTYLAKTDNIRSCVKNFATDYVNFRNNYNREPSCKSEIVEEHKLYEKYRWYCSDEKLSNEEIAYLQKHGIKVVKIKKEKTFSL